MDKFINLIAQTINEADDPYEVTKGGLWEQEEEYEEGDPFYEKGAKAQEDVRRWGPEGKLRPESEARDRAAEEHASRKHYEEQVRKPTWNLFDSALRNLEDRARTLRGQPEQDNLVAGELPSFRELDHLCRTKINVDFRYPRHLDEATRTSERKMSQFGWSRLEIYANNRRGVKLRKTLSKIWDLKPEEFLKTYSSEGLAKILGNFDRLDPDFLDAQTILDRIAAKHLTPADLAERLSSQYVKVQSVSTPTAEPTDRIQLYIANQDVHILEIQLYFRHQQNPEIIKLDQVLKPRTHSDVIRISNFKETITKVDVMYLLPKKAASGIQILGLAGGKDENASAYLRRLDQAQFRNYLRHKGGDKLLQPGKPTPGNIRQRQTAAGVSYKNLPFELAATEVNSFMQKLLQLKLNVIAVSPDGSKLRNWIKRIFDVRFPDYEVWIKDHKLLKTRDGQWMFTAASLTDYTPESGFTIKDIEKSVAQAKLSMMDKLTDIELPGTSEKLLELLRKQRRRRGFDTQDLFKYDSSQSQRSEYAKKEYCDQVLKIISSMNEDYLAKVNSSFEVVGLINYRPPDDDFKNIGRFILQHFFNYIDNFRAQLAEAMLNIDGPGQTRGLIVGGVITGKGGREIPQLRDTRYKVKIDKNSGIQKGFEQIPEIVQRVGPAKSAKKIRDWDPILEKGQPSDQCVLKFDVHGEPYYVGTTLEEVYTRGLTDNKEPRNLKEFGSRLENVEILPVEGNENNVNKSAGILGQIAQNYAELMALDASEFLKEVVAASKISWARKDNLDDLDNALKYIKNKLSLDLNIDVLTEGEKLLRTKKAKAWACITVAVKHHLGNYRKGSKSGWKPGFLIGVRYTLTRNIQRRKDTKVTGGIKCGAYYWDRASEQSEMAGSYPVFYQAWVPESSEVQAPNVPQETETLKDVKLNSWPEHSNPKQHIAIKYKSENCICLHPESHHQVEETDEDLLGPAKTMQVKTPLTQGKCTDETPVRDKKGKQIFTDHGQPKTKKCDCKKFEKGRVETFTENMTARDFYEKDIKNQFELVSIEDASNLGDDDDYIAKAKIAMYTDPLYDNDHTGTKCDYCSVKDGPAVYHPDLVKLGDTSYEKDSTWDDSAKLRGYLPNQLVRLEYKVSDHGEDPVSVSAILRRHEITERQLHTKLQPTPVIRPAADPQAYRDLNSILSTVIQTFPYPKSTKDKILWSLQSILIHKIVLPDENEEITKAVRAVIGKLKESENFTEILKTLKNEQEQAFVVYPASDKQEDGSFDQPPTVEKATPKELGNMRAHKAKAQNLEANRRLPDGSRWVLDLKIPNTIDDSIDNNGADLSPLEWTDPKRPGGPEKNETKPFNVNKEVVLYDSLVQAVSTGKTTERAFIDPLTGDLAPWIAHASSQDVYYLIIPPVNQKFIDTMGTKKRGETIRGLSDADKMCYDCDREVGFLPIQRAPDQSWWVEIPYVRKDKQGNTLFPAEIIEFDVPLSNALEQMKDLWVSHRWRNKKLHYPEIHIDSEIDDSSIDGFKTFSLNVLTAQELVRIGEAGAVKPGNTPVSKALGVINRKLYSNRSEGVTTCQNPIWDVKAKAQKICGQRAFIDKTPKTLVSIVQEDGSRKWRVEHPAMASALKNLSSANLSSASDDERSDAEDEFAEAKLLEETHPERVEKFCQSCFISRFNLFPDYIIQEMNGDLKGVLNLVNKFWVTGDDEPSIDIQKIRKRSISKLLENFAIKWFSDRSFWSTWDNYILREVSLKGVSRQGTTLPDYLTKNLLRARYMVMKKLEEITLDPAMYIDAILRKNSVSGKPDYVTAIERIQSIISSWGIWNNSFKLKGYERSKFQRGDTGLIHTKSLWSLMTAAEKNRPAYDAGQSSKPLSVQQSERVGNESLDRDFVIIDGLVGKDAYLNGLGGYVESIEADGTLIVELKENFIVADRRIKLLEGECIFFSKSFEIPPVILTFEDKHRLMIVEEDKKRLEELDVIRLVGKFTHDSLYW